MGVHITKKSLGGFLDHFHLLLMGILKQIIYNKLIVQSKIENPHNNQTMIFNISYHDFYNLC